MGSSESTQNGTRSDSESESESYIGKAAKVAGAVAVGVGVVALGASALLSSAGSEVPGKTSDERTMKAPGRNGTRIARDEFEENPKDYFSKLHRDQKEEKNIK